MEFITPYAEIIEQNTKTPLEGMYEHIARCTRVCYQSTHMNNGETDEEFVKRVILRHKPWNSEANHLAMLEHGTVYLNCPNILYNNMLGDKYTETVYDKENKQYCITTNLRVLVERECINLLKEAVIPTIHKRRVTVFFTTNIGVTREFNRHRVNSIAEESTRYCNYNLDKFNNNVKFALPSWIKESELEIQAFRNDEVESDMYAQMRLDELDENWTPIDWYLYALSTSALAYKKLIELGWKPQQAREVLPLATKSQLVHTAFVDDWKHFFALRADGISGPVHPNAKLLAAPLKEKFIKRKLI